MQLAVLLDSSNSVTSAEFGEIKALLRADLQRYNFSGSNISIKYISLGSSLQKARESSLFNDAYTKLQNLPYIGGRFKEGIMQDNIGKILDFGNKDVPTQILVFTTIKNQHLTSRKNLETIRNEFRDVGVQTKIFVLDNEGQKNRPDNPIAYYIDGTSNFPKSIEVISSEINRLLGMILHTSSLRKILFSSVCNAWQKRRVTLFI